MCIRDSTEAVASKMALKMDLSVMISKAISKKGWTQIEAAEHLEVTQSRISDLKNNKIEKFTLDAMFDMLDKIGFRAKLNDPSLDEASISISKAVNL